MTTLQKDFNIKATSRLLGVHQDTMKYWEEHRLIPPARRNPANKYRVYNLKEIREIARVRGICEKELESAIESLRHSTC
jgi:DNA-binding transcriptional MerR regulator